MEKASLYIGDDNFVASLKKRLLQHGFAQIVASTSPAELYAEAVEAPPSVAVIEHGPGDRNLATMVKKLSEKLSLPVVILAESGDIPAVQAWGASTVATILAKPVREEELVAAMVLSVAAARRVERLKEEVATLREGMETRKVVERAKGRLMERDRLSEAEAFRRMQRLAMDRRISMRQLAEAILLTDRIGA